MNRKDYERAATIVQTIEDETGRKVAAWAFARLFENDNPNFDSARFRRACEPGANVKARS